MTGGERGEEHGGEEHGGDAPSGRTLYGNSGGPVLTFLDNPFVLAPVWSGFVENLAREFHILTVDGRGSTEVESTMSAEVESTMSAEVDSGHSRRVADVVEAHRRANIRRSYVVGTSFSTLVAREYACTRPDAVAGMILVNPVFGPYGDRRRKALVRSWIATLNSGGLAGLFDHVFPLLYTDRTISTGGSAMYLALRERFIAMNSDVGFRRMLESTLRVDDDPRQLRRVSCPTLVMGGEADFFSDPQGVEVLARLIPNGRAQIVRGGGHLLHMDSTDVFERSIAAFVREVERTERHRGDLSAVGDAR